VLFAAAAAVPADGAMALDAAAPVSAPAAAWLLSDLLHATTSVAATSMASPAVLDSIEASGWADCERIIGQRARSAPGHGRARAQSAVSRRPDAVE
jgi:hypothetical protein